MVFQDDERFKNLCSGIQSLAIAAAVVVGGLWTAYVFNSELKVENAKAQLVKVNRDLEVKANLEFDISANALKVSSVKYRIINVDITIHNKGNRPTILKFLKPTLRAAKIKFTDESKIEFERIITSQPTLINSDGEKWEFDWKVIKSAEKDYITFLIKIDEPGIYLLTFEATGIDADTYEAREAGAPDSQDVVAWVASKYIAVE